jgi:hypothetical protein
MSRVVFAWLVAVWQRLRCLTVARRIAFASVMLIALAPARVHAQQGDWIDQRYGGGTYDDLSSASDEPTPARWLLSMGIGPYMPQIDPQVRGMPGPGPYEQMFGAHPSWIPALTLERVVARRFGSQWLAGITGAYLQTSAHAWAICTAEGERIGDCDGTPGDSLRTRSSSTNTFHLVPLSLIASYRYTQLDDEHVAPIVPYARVGLSDYAWWVHDPNAHVASYMTNSPEGSSLGLQATIGVSLRAERIDSDAARSLRDSGLLHGGFFFEVTAAWVNGFGNASKQSVGDTTWFAGVNFEF